MALVEQWRAIERELPEGWGDARLVLTVAPAAADRAAALLGPAQPGREGNRLRFICARNGFGAAPEAIRRLLARLDGEGVDGSLELAGTDAAEPPPPPVERATLAASWDAALAELPSDWSDLLGEVELTSTDYLERAALLMGPLNPLRDGKRPAFRFRSARNFGYGASPGMARRCLERCDAEQMRGSVRILWVLCDTHPVATQGPVWYVGGRTV